MVHFTDAKYYVKGICTAIARDPATGDVLFASDKFSTGNITHSVNAEPLRAGLGMGIAAIVEDSGDITVNFTQANFDLRVKAASVGAAISYNAVVPACQTVTATGTTLSIDVSGGAPVADYGYSKAVCYVQTVGSSSFVDVDGVAYDIDPLTGNISGFTATSGTTYKVWYSVNRASAAVATVNSDMNGRVIDFVAQYAVYTNVNTSANSGTRVGWIYTHHLLKLQAEGANLNGDQSNYDTSTIVGRAIARDEDVVSAVCEDCTSSTLEHIVFAPDNGANQIVGLVVIGGLVSLVRSTSKQIPVRFAFANGSTALVTDFTGFTFTGSGLPSGTTVSAKGVISGGSTAGSGEVNIAYSGDGLSLSCPVNVEVTAS